MTEFDYSKSYTKIGIADCKDFAAQECLTDFINSVSQEISVSCAIPFSVPSQSIAQIVKNTKEYFYRNYEDCIEDQYLAVPKKYLQNSNFKKSVDTNTDISATRGRLLLPNNVYSIYGVYEIGGFSGEGSFGAWHDGDYDFSTKNLIWGNMINDDIAISADNMAYYIIKSSMIDQARQIFQHPIGFSYNRLSHRLTFTGQLPTKDVVLHTLTTIENCALFEDPYFRRYVIAECKIQMKRILSAFNYTLPGGISINADIISNDGENEKQMIIQEIKDMRTNGYIMMF